MGQLNTSWWGSPGTSSPVRSPRSSSRSSKSGTVRVLDLIFIGKDDDGDVLAFEIDELDGGDAFDNLAGEFGGLISPEDIEFVASKLEPGNSAALLLWEDLWAAPFAQAVRNSGGVLLEGARIPHELIEPAITALPQAV